MSISLDLWIGLMNGLMERLRMVELDKLIEIDSWAGWMRIVEMDELKRWTGCCVGRTDGDD